jgi:hypothetical protein
MTRADAVVFARLLQGLAETFDVVLTVTRIELYFRALEDLPLETIQHVTSHALRESRFFPKPAELRAFLENTIPERAEMAWLQLLEAFQRGYAETVLPEDPITQALVYVYWRDAYKAREWWRFCHDAALEAKHREFVARYREYAAKRPEELPALPGVRVMGLRPPVAIQP